MKESRLSEIEKKYKLSGFEKTIETFVETNTSYIDLRQHAAIVNIILGLIFGICFYCFNSISIRTFIIVFAVFLFLYYIVFQIIKDYEKIINAKHKIDFRREFLDKDECSLVKLYFSLFLESILAKDSFLGQVEIRLMTAEAFIKATIEDMTSAFEGMKEKKQEPDQNIICFSKRLKLIYEHLKNIKHELDDAKREIGALYYNSLSIEFDGSEDAETLMKRKEENYLQKVEVRTDIKDFLEKINNRLASFKVILEQKRKELAVHVADTASEEKDLDIDLQELIKQYLQLILE